MGDADGMDGQYGKGNVTISSGDTSEVLWYADGTNIASEVHLTMADNGDLISLTNKTIGDDFFDFAFDDDFNFTTDDDFNFTTDDDFNFTFDDDQVNDLMNIDDDDVYWETFKEVYNITDDFYTLDDTFNAFDPTMDSEWPGRFPEDTSTIIFNVKTDDYPEEMSWTWSRLEGGKWQILSKEQAPEKSTDTLLSSESPRLVPGSIYRVLVVDSFADGAFGFHEGAGKGWFSLTNATMPENGKEKGTVMWSAAGYDYTKELEVFVSVDNEGNTKHVVPIEGGAYAAPKLLVDEEDVSEENEENLQIIGPVEDSADPVARNELGSFP